MIKIGVVGSRRRNSENDLQLLYKTIKEYIDIYGLENIILVSGGCPKGADNFCEIIHNNLDFPKDMIIHYPDKSKLDPRLNYRAAYAVICYERNTKIAEDSDILIAMVAPDRKGGTEDTIKKFKRYKKANPILI